MMVEHLSALYQLSDDTGVTFVYCNFKESRTSAEYIRLAMKQLCRRMKSLPPKLQDAYEKHYQADSQPNFEELQNIFLAIARHFNSMFLVFDALDECSLDQREELCDFFCKIIELTAEPDSASSTHSTPASKTEYKVGSAHSATISARSIKVFVTSRKKPDIEQVCRQKSFPKVEIEAKKVDCDIAIYIKAQIEEKINAKRLTLGNMTLKDEILTTLTTKASGM